MKNIFLAFMFNILKIRHDLPFLPERMKIEKVEKLLANLHDKAEYVLHIRNLEQALNQGLFFKKVHRVIKFHQNAWLKPYIDMNIYLRKIAKVDFGKDFFKLINNAVFGKTVENMRKHRDTKLITTKKEETIWCQNQTISVSNWINEI